LYVSSTGGPNLRQAKKAASSKIAATALRPWTQAKTIRRDHNQPGAELDRVIGLPAEQAAPNPGLHVNCRGIYFPVSWRISAGASEDRSSLLQEIIYGIRPK
jgi:hypothetical protein